jgi:hypothetical protein
MGGAWEPSKNGSAVAEVAEHWTENHFHFFVFQVLRCHMYIAQLCEQELSAVTVRQGIARELFGLLTVAWNWLN